MNGVEAHELYPALIAKVYSRVKRCTGYELVPDGADSMLIFQHGELLGGYAIEEEAQELQAISIKVDDPDKFFSMFIDKAAEALLELIKKSV